MRAARSCWSSPSRPRVAGAYHERARPLDWVVAGLVVVVGFAAFRHRQAVELLEVGKRAEAESFARILQGLSRSISADAGAAVTRAANAMVIRVGSARTRSSG